MNQYLQLETSPVFVLLCLLAGIGYAYLLYRRNEQRWSRTINRIFFAMRALLIASIAFLLLGPIVKRINNMYEKPVVVIIRDNSASITETTDSTTLHKIGKDLEGTEEALQKKGYEVNTTDLDGRKITAADVRYTETTSDLNAALKRVTNQYEGKNVASVILVSDGIYNAGLSPLYSIYNFPVYTIGVGDTSQRVDIAIKNIQYNKLAYQGNKFPVHVDILLKQITGKSIAVSLHAKGKEVARQTKMSGNNMLLGYDFLVTAQEQGIQKIDVKVDADSRENNTRNNHASIFVEVVEGKKKILLVAPFPHPDIKAFQEVVDKNSNYEFFLYIPGTKEQPADVLQPDKIDLAILLQTPDLRGRTREIFQRFVNSKTSLLLGLGQQSDLLALMRSGMPIKFSSLPGDYDEVTPFINQTFPYFTIAPENNSIVEDYPPASVHFGKLQLPLNAVPLLYQRVGSVVTDKPLLAVQALNERKIGILLSEGIWRWRLNEYDRTENTIAFDELFGKLIQYLSTTDDKRKFKSYPVQQEFSDEEPVIFESQVYNDIYEPIYGNTIHVDITDEAGKRKSYSYVTSQGNTRYQIGGLKEGVYKYRASTSLNGKTEETKGEFIVTASRAELQNLTADFDLLKKLSDNTGGTFYTGSQIGSLTDKLQQTQAKSIIHTEEMYNSVINLKVIFWLLIALLSAEWFLRKYYGTY